MVNTNYSKSMLIFNTTIHHDIKQQLHWEHKKFVQF